MASDDVNITEDAEMAECDGDKVVTMMDVLQEQQEFEEDANAVLGASDDKNCTYSKGYIKRQALYACLTCCTDAKVDPTKRAGVCLACSLNCHENHELIELYTKRNFRCDCGNPKFNSHPCQYTPDKTDLNEDNIYNQNFSGLYCTCKRPYPDPESTIEDDMIQCIICEDWLHASHLEAVVPANDQYAEMVCKNCMETNQFLHDYSMFAVTAEAGDVDIVTVNGDTKLTENGHCNGDSETERMVNGVEENKSNIATTSFNKDVAMDEVKEKSSDKATDSTDNKKNEENVAAEINDDSKQDNISNVESSELLPEDKEKPENNKMDLDTESQIAEEKEQSVGIPDTNEQTINDNPAEHVTSENTLEKSNDTLDAAETAPIDDPEKVKETTTGKPENTDKKSENSDSIDHKIESRENELEKGDETMEEQNDDQISKHSIIADGEFADNVQTNKTDTSEITEQQLLDDLTVLTAEKTDADPKEDSNIATEEKSVESMEEPKDIEEKEEATEEKCVESMEEPKDITEKEEATEEECVESMEEPKDIEEKEATEEKCVESMEEPKDNKEKEEAETNNEDSPKDTVNISEDLPDEKTVVDDETTGNIEVPDTSQNAVEKTDSVMDAIDELLQTANEAKESDTDTIEAKESNDVEISAREEKHDEPEKAENVTESNDKPSTNDFEDVEMNEPTIQNESKVDNCSTDSENKDANDAEVTKNELVTDKKPEETDTVNESSSQENITLNETDDKIKTLNESDDNRKTLNETDNQLINSKVNENAPSKDDNEASVTENGKEHKRKLSTDLTDDISPKKAKLECVRPKKVKRVHKGATFWPSNFRQKLCTCGDCLTMYKDLKVLFLTDLEDTVFAYERLGKENVTGGASQYEKGMLALSSLDRIQQINALTEYNRMRDKLLDFLKSFKDRKEIVKEEDIKAFFAGMKPRREPDGVYFCR